MTFILKYVNELSQWRICVENIFIDDILGTSKEA